jgi:predicted RNA binding protein YcfA (HicA-like mRNA interferase family)
MKLPRDLDGRELAGILCRDWDYQVAHLEGSHIILQTGKPSHQRLSVPAHSPLRIGILSPFLRQVARHKGVDRDAILGGR